MDTSQSIEHIIRKILAYGSYTEDELDRLFRALSKQTHPDLGGGDGEAFIRLRAAYETAKSRLQCPPSAASASSQSSAPASSPQGRPAAYGRAEENSGYTSRAEYSASYWAQSDSTARTSQHGPGGTSEPSSPPGSSAPGRAQAGEARQRPMPFDPHAIIAEAGYPEVRDPRGSLYIVLHWFFTKGMQHHRIRSMKGLRKRNRRIIRTIFYWARLYHPSFVSLFAAYHRNRYQFLTTTWEIKNYNYAKRLFLDGISGFFNYQFSGRKGTIAVAREKLDLAAHILTRCLGKDHPLRQLCGWFLSEAEKPPCFTTRS